MGVVLKQASKSVMDALLNRRVKVHQSLMLISERFSSENYNVCQAVSVCVRVFKRLQR